MSISILSYEKRFFRTFEDAMQPPPSFRRSKIATKKPDLPVKGWEGCFKQELDVNRTRTSTGTSSQPDREHVSMCMCVFFFISSYIY